VSHELRSPLTRLQIALGIARKKDQPQILTAEHDRIERAVGQVDGLVAQILDLARLQQTDTRGLQSEKRHLHGQMTQWLQDAELEVEAHGLTLKSALPPDTLVCQWDWILVERAFDNLLRNAIRFSPENGVLRVGATVRERAVELWVEDQGPGVPEDELERIFAPFTQVDPARDHASGGYGIGLALVKRIVELHDGIVVASNQSQGLRVAMTLPIGK